MCPRKAVAITRRAPVTLDTENIGPSQRRPVNGIWSALDPGTNRELRAFPFRICHEHSPPRKPHWHPSHPLPLAGDNTTFCNPTFLGCSFHMGPNQMPQMATGTSSCRYRADTYAKPSHQDAILATSDCTKYTYMPV